MRHGRLPTHTTQNDLITLSQEVRTTTCLISQRSVTTDRVNHKIPRTLNCVHETQRIPHSIKSSQPYTNFLPLDCTAVPDPFVEDWRSSLFHALSNDATQSSLHDYHQRFPNKDKDKEVYLHWSNKVTPNNVYLVNHENAGTTRLAYV
jgi:hypothetical protein